MKQLALAAVMLFVAGGAMAEPLRMGGGTIEILVRELTDRTVRVDLAPLDDAAKAQAPAPSSVIVASAGAARIALRELDDAKSIHIGKFQVTIKGKPLTITVESDGKVVQELIVHESDGSIVFRTEGPTFGLGEGRQQFDRRGFYFDFLNGQNEFLATHGGTIP